jgi:hypothetical protein
MLRCELGDSSVHPTLRLALRDLRQASGRDVVTGAGAASASWIGLSIGMIVLDTLTGPGTQGVRKRWVRLLTEHGVTEEDARIVYALRCSLLHGYGVPEPTLAAGRRVLLSDDAEAFALDTSTPGRAVLSVPVVTGRLVERIAFEARDDWDDTLLDSDLRL